MDRAQGLRDIITLFDLNRHPFYVEWRNGSLPVERLASYAAGFDGFVAAVADGWEAAGRPDYAADERSHHELWRGFRAAVNAPGEVDSPQTRTLTLVAGSLFQSAPEAIGALFAFEAQQPATSRSKLDGLKEHYDVGQAGQEYFRVHADDWTEARHLEDLMRELPEPEFQRARSACALLAAALWSGLDGVYYS